MATEIHRESHADAPRQALSVDSAADLISGMMGRGAAPKPAEEPPEPPEPEAAPETDDPSEEPEAEEARAEPEPRKEAKKPDDDGTQDDVQEIELEPAELAHLLGVEESDLEFDEDGALGYRVKVDGETGRVSLQDLRESYQLAKTHQRRLSKLDEERKAFEAERQQTLQSLVTQHQQYTQALQKLASDYANDFKAVDWQRLREEDPTEYLSRRQDFEDRKRQISEYQAEAQKRAQELTTQHTQEIQKRQAEGSKRLDELFAGPEYANAPKWDQAEKDRLFKWIVSQGFSAEDVNRASAWQMFKWARDSMLRESEKVTATQTAKKLKRLPKIVKPGQPKPVREAKRQKVSELKSRQRKQGGDLNSTADLIRGIFNS